MLWYWRVRIYRGDNYAIGWLTTKRDLQHIDTIQDNYKAMTGYPMILEGMNEVPSPGIDIKTAFTTLWDKP